MSEYLVRATEGLYCNQVDQNHWPIKYYSEATWGEMCLCHSYDPIIGCPSIGQKCGQVGRDKSLFRLGFFLLQGEINIKLKLINHKKGIYGNTQDKTEHQLSVRHHQRMKQPIPMPIVKLVLICKAMGICLIFCKHWSAYFGPLVYKTSIRSPLSCISKQAWQ